MRNALLTVAYGLALLGCEAYQHSIDEGPVDTASPDGDSDTDTDTDADSDTDSDTDGDTDPEVEWSYIWIANSGEGTLSKVDTLTLVEVARYATCPGSSCDPSRTSVNLYGDAVVTNRQPNVGPSSVTKFAATLDHCVDLNDDEVIQTSSGPSDVLPFGEDECMVWHTELPGDVQIGARATAWDGEEDPETGEGGHVWIGTYQQYSDTSAEELVFLLDGDTGEILTDVAIPCGAYGGAMDGDGGLWLANNSQTGDQAIVRVDTETLAVETHPVPGAYGITVDSQGRVWTTASSWVIRYDPSTDSYDQGSISTGLFGWGRGIAAGVGASEGTVWVAETGGALIQIDEETMEVIETVALDGAIVGAAVDFEGNAWGISLTNNRAYKVDPETYAFEYVTIGQSPYTYSDMTGMQLKQVVDPE